MVGDPRDDFGTASAEAANEAKFVKSAPRSQSKKANLIDGATKSDNM
jgi:hypothetical protein